MCWGFQPSLAVSVVGCLLMCVLVQNAETGICEGGITAMASPLSSNPDPVTCFCDLVDLRLGVHSAKMESVKVAFEQFHYLYWTQSSRGGLSCTRSIITCFCTLAASSHSN